MDHEKHFETFEVFASIFWSNGQEKENFGVIMTLTKFILFTKKVIDDIILYIYISLITYYLQIICTNKLITIKDTLEGYHKS